MTHIALIDYGAGNITSVYNALQKIINEYHLDANIIITHDKNDIALADRLILPGVGSFKACMDGILVRDGLKDALDKAVLQDKKPFLGICVGMQLLAEQGEEFGSSQGLGYLAGTVKRFDSRITDKIPHMGWNKIIKHHDHPLLTDIHTGDYVYYVHSYFMQTKPDYIYLSSRYGIDVAGLVIKDNIAGTQFHPEKSQKTGLIFLRNFITWKI